MSAQTAGQQLSLTEAFAEAPTAEPEPDEPQDTVREDRVVDDALTCSCGRPAGADGHCTACRRQYAGEAIGNHGGRL